MSQKPAGHPVLKHVNLVFQRASRREFCVSEPWADQVRHGKLAVTVGPRPSHGVNGFHGSPNRFRTSMIRLSSFSAQRLRQSSGSVSLAS